MGFWSKLLGIGAIAAAPFTGGTSLAFLPGALSAGAGVAGMLENKNGGGGGSAGNTGINGLVQQQQQNLQRVGQAGDYAFNAEQKALNPTLGYYRRLTSGDPNAAMEAISPEVGTILSQYDTARQAAAQSTPRGGGRTRALANMPFQKAGTIQNLLFGARRDAFDKLGTLGTQLGSEATSRMATGVSGTNSLFSNQLDYQKMIYQQQKEKGAAIGSFINAILGGLSGLKLGGGGGGSSTPPSNADLPAFNTNTPGPGFVY